MPKKKRTPNLPWEMTREELEKHIAERFSVWDDTFENGCCDPTWEDGCNLNLVRSHIIFAYKYLDKLNNSAEQLDIFAMCGENAERRQLPPKVDNKYMARLDDLIAKARETAEAVEQDDNYIWLVSIGKKLTGKEKQKIYFDTNVQGREFVESMIEGKMYPRLRRWGSDRGMEYYGSCKGYQLTMIKELRERWCEKYADLFAEAEHRIPDLFQQMPLKNEKKPSVQEALAAGKAKADAHNAKLPLQDKQRTSLERAAAI